ncbi:MAG: sugar phosphate isomerase/epimerase [Oscillospiraceae bacterium]|nr:sugar phosphate isomerase/epimerase [Oscillospiraceae bacterium]
MKYRLCAFADEADPMLPGQIAAMGRNGIRLLEIRGVDGENISVLSPAKVKQVAALLADNGLAVWSIGSPTGKIKLFDDFHAHVESFRGMLDASAVLGAKAFRMFSFYEAQEEKNEVIDRLGILCDLAKGYGVKLCHENEKGIFGDTPERTRQLLDALPQLGGIFDPANFIQCGAEILPAWELLKDRIDYLHVKDATRDGTVVPAGCGVGALETVVTDFLSRGGEVLTLEPHLADFVGLHGLEQEGERTVLGSAKFSFRDNNHAFDTAVDSLKTILNRSGAVAL